VELVTAEENKRLQVMRDHIIDHILSEIPDTTLNGHRWKRLPQNVNISFHFVEGESITLHLDLHGFAVSTGSACFSRSLQGSHVIYGIGGDHERAHGSIRITLGRYNTIEEVDAAVQTLAEIVQELRSISPLGKEKREEEE
jgi:cysteine desulfurase